jgi:hypothetical protein
MGKALEYFAEKHDILTRAYSLGFYYSEPCSLIAKGIARRLLGEGAKPSILKINGKLIKENYQTLCPIPLSKENVEWGAHFVCFCNGKIYDPIFEKPISKKEYFHRMFNQEISIRDATCDILR